MMKKKKKNSSLFPWIFVTACAIFVIVSLFAEFQPGKEMGRTFLSFLKEMALVIPGAFILIGLFEIWVPKSVIEKHLGSESSLLSHFWVFLLAGTTVGGLYLAFPVAHAIRSKGAKLAVIFSYIGFSGVARIPMTLFEISFLGLRFTLIRYLAAVPLIILSSEILGAYLEKRNFTMKEPRR